MYQNKARWTVLTNRLFLWQPSFCWQVLGFQRKNPLKNVSFYLLDKSQKANSHENLYPKSLNSTHFALDLRPAENLTWYNGQTASEVSSKIYIYQVLGKIYSKSSKLSEFPVVNPRGLFPTILVTVKICPWKRSLSQFNLFPIKLPI